MPPRELSMELGPIEIAPAYEVVVRYLRRAIHLGEFAPGAKLPTERDLAELMVVSRATLREALRELKGEGYVEIRRGPRGGVFVRESFASNEALDKWFQELGTDLEGVSDFRLSVEPLAARRAAARAKPALLNSLEKLNAVMAETQEIGEFRQADLRFHMQIADAADAELVRHAVEEARAALFLPFQLLDLAEMRDRAVPQHAAIIRALRDKDGDAAARAMADHVRSTGAAMRPSPRGRKRPPRSTSP